MAGLKMKYTLTKADGSAVDSKGIYFILKPNSKDEAHAKASIKALYAYADTILHKNQKLSDDLYKLADACREAKAGNFELLLDLGFKNA